MIHNSIPSRPAPAAPHPARQGPRALRAVALGGVAVLSVAALTGCTAAEPPATAPPTKAAPKKEAEPTVPAPPAALTGQRLDWAACPKPSTAQGGGDAPGPGWECATLKAPVDHMKPGGRTLDVAMIRKKATGPEKDRIGSLLFNFGGPGESGVSALPEFAEEYTKLGTRYDLVSFDPRGVGNTIPVHCTTEDDVDVYTYNESCEKKSGNILDQVRTTSTARDMDLMRRVLGDEKLHYFGISYGTELGGVYAHLYPKNVGRAVLDAAIDPTLDDKGLALAEAKGFQQALDAYMAHCARTEGAACPTGRDPEQGNDRLLKLLDGLAKKPAATDDGREVNADTARIGIVNTLYSGEDGWEVLTDALREVTRDRTGNGLLDLADDYNGRFAAPAPRAKDQSDNSVAALTAITCADSSLRLDDDEIDALLPQFKKVSPVFGEDSALTLYNCADWPVAGERADPAVDAAGAPPILVIGNTGDPATPFEGSKRMAEELGEGVGVHLTVEGEGHGSYGVDSCATATADAYLLDGKVPADGKVCKA